MKQMSFPQKLLIFFELSECFKVLMVMGGTQSPYASFPHSSTELLVQGASTWTNTGSLPAWIKAVRGTNIDNKVLVMGKSRVLNSFRKCSLSYNFFLIFRWIWSGFGK